MQVNLVHPTPHPIPAAEHRCKSPANKTRENSLIDYDDDDVSSGTRCIIIIAIAIL